MAKLKPLRGAQMRDEAEKEYYYLENEIGRYDQMCHGIKNWSITISFALLATGFAQKVPSLFLLASLAALLFWKTEARWKRIQRIHGIRIRHLEKYLNGESEDYTGPQIARNITEQFMLYGSNYFSRTFRITLREFRVMTYANVQLPHNVIFLVGVILFILSKLNCINF